MRWTAFTQFCSKFIQETIYRISSESPQFCRRYYEKHFCFTVNVEDFLWLEDVLPVHSYFSGVQWIRASQ